MTPSNPQFAATVRACFDNQPAMRLIRATLPVIEPGRAEIHLVPWEGVEQQHGYVHGGVVGMIADTAAGLAAMTLAPPDASVVTVEYKLNITAPAVGERIVARGRVARAGRTLIITTAELFAITGERETLCALMQQTIMALPGKAEKNRAAAPTPS